MSPEIMTIVLMTAAVMALLTFWRKVLAVLLSVAIAVFFYGLIDLTHLLRLP